MEIAGFGDLITETRTLAAGVGREGPSSNRLEAGPRGLPPVGLAGRPVRSASGCGIVEDDDRADRGCLTTRWTAYDCPTCKA